VERWNDGIADNGNMEYWNAGIKRDQSKGKVIQWNRRPELEQKKRDRGL